MRPNSSSPSGSTITHLRRMELFDGASPSELGDLARLFRQCTALPGQALEVQDTPVRWWSVIVSGHALVERDHTPFGLLGSLESWSEHSLLTRQPSPISVVALSPLRALSITDRQFDQLVRGNVAVGTRLVERSATSADRLALPVYRALTHMQRAEDERQRAELAEIGRHR
jgi:CRP-like cAMP-binding protein